MRRTLLALLLGVLTSAPVLAMDLAVTGSWTLPVTATDLVAGAGSALRATVDSGASDVRVDVDLTAGDADAWRLEIRRSDGSWDPDLRVWVRRSGDGTGTGTIAGGDTWVEVGPTNSILFEGSGDRQDVPIQLRLGGLSLGVTPAAYLTALQYTLVDTP
ncbi:MAG: hypothetical protein ACK4YP_08930 [Myxococcota bacterium]